MEMKLNCTDKLNFMVLKKLSLIRFKQFKSVIKITFISFFPDSKCCV